jgi:hypothetical protein
MAGVRGLDHRFGKPREMSTPRHFWKVRQELATLKQLAGLSKNALAWPKR